MLEAADSRFWLCQLTPVEPMHYSKHSGNDVSDPSHWGFEMLLWVLGFCSDAFCQMPLMPLVGEASAYIREEAERCGKRRVLK